MTTTTGEGRDMPNEQDTQEEQTDATQEQQATQEETPEETPGEEEVETFDRDYVEKLRKEAGDYRVKAKKADDLATALWSANVAASGRLADATDLAMPEGADPLDAEAVSTAIEELLTRKPHLASRALSGDVGQGATGAASAGAVDLGGMLRQGA